MLKRYLMFPCSIFLFVSLSARDPFSVPSLPSIRRAPRPSRRVVGILEVDGSRSAILCVGGKTKIVREGDRIDQYKVVKIDRQKVVTIRKNSKEETWSVDTL